MNNSGSLRDTGAFYPTGIFFLASFGYFFFIGNYVLYFQETQSLFVFSREYLHDHLLKPGGLLEYSARFMAQFYYNRFLGSVVLSLILTTPAILIYYLNKRIIAVIHFSILLLLLPSCLMFILQAHYYNLMEYNLGFLLVIAFYLLSVSLAGKYKPIILFVLFPLFYYLTGAFSMVFVVMYISHSLFLGEGSRSYTYPLIMIAVATISFIISWKVIFLLQPMQQLILFPLPVLDNPLYRAVFIILSGYIVFYPLICKRVARIKEKRFKRKSHSYGTLIVFVAVCIFLVFKIYNPQTARVVEMERLVFEEKYDEAIDFHEKKPSLNLIGQYFYNIALSETDQLCDRLFFGRQDFSAGALVLPWGDNHLNRGAYFYYATGLINEAHRWAYEEMVVYGYRPQNIELLAKTCLISGDCDMARKYLNIMKRTIFYRKWAKEFEKMADNPELIRSHPELGAKFKIVPPNNFFIQFNEPQNNLPLLLEGRPENRKAIEYYLAGLLLTKKTEIAVNNVKNLKESGYTKIPRHLEEAILVYYNSTGVSPDLGGLTITPETRQRFERYFSAYRSARNNPSTLKDKMEKNYGNTFWFYFHFK